MIPNQQAVTTLVAMVTRKNLGQLTELLFKLLKFGDVCPGVIRQVVRIFRP